MAGVADPETEQLVLAQLRALSDIERLVDVDESFKDTLRFIAHRVLGNGWVNLFLYQVTQLSELGTGFNGTFENGGTQSDRRDDVRMDFIVGMGGQPCTIRLRGDQITVHDGDRGRSVPFAALSHRERPALARTLDDLLRLWWTGR